MARKAAHDQRSTPNNWSCGECKQNNCEGCIDIMRVVVLKLPQLCFCKRRNHSGEPVNQQIKDPETGTVYAPGLKVTKDGEVIHNA